MKAGEHWIQGEKAPCYSCGKEWSIWAWCLFACVDCQEIHVVCHACIETIPEKWIWFKDGTPVRERLGGGSLFWHLLQRVSLSTMWFVKHCPQKFRVAKEFENVAAEVG